MQLAGERDDAVEDVLFPGLNGENLLVGQAEVDELEAVEAVGAECFSKACGGALSGRGGIVELVRQVAGELAEGIELFSLLLDSGNFTDAVEERGDDALGHGRDGLKHLGEQGFGNEESPDGGDRESLAAVGFHAGEGEDTGHLSCAANEQSHGAAVLAAHVDFAFEDEDHVRGLSALFEENIAGVGDELLSVVGEPEAFFQRQVVEWANAQKSVGDLVDRGGRGWRDYGLGEHPGTSGLTDSE